MNLFELVYEKYFALPNTSGHISGGKDNFFLYVYHRYEIFSEPLVRLSVYVRDLIRVSRIDGETVIIHCRGEFHPEAGSTTITFR